MRETHGRLSAARRSFTDWGLSAGFRVQGFDIEPGTLNPELNFALHRDNMPVTERWNLEGEGTRTFSCGDLRGTRSRCY